MGLFRWAFLGALGGSIVGYLGCVGDLPDPTIRSNDDGGTPGDGTTNVSDGGAPELAPDAAPSIGCPLGCLPPAPAGWTGPSAVYDGPPGTKPTTCPAPYTLPELEAHGDVSGEPAACGCGAPAFAGAKCTFPLYSWTSTDCRTGGTQLPSVVVPDNPCLNVATGVRVTVDTGGSLNRGTCSFPSPEKVVPEPTFATVDVICGLPQVGTCESRPDCAVSPVPDAPYNRLCIHKPGDELCPSADYPKRFVVYTKVTDTRDCSACTGTPTDGGCGTKWGPAGTCERGNPPVSHTTRDCVNPATEGSVMNLAAMGPTGINCAAAGGTPVGDVANAEPVSICCNK